MIVSVHIPKTGGRTFQRLLRKRFGPRLLEDYGDWMDYGGPDAFAHNARRRQRLIAELDATRSGYDAVHGHFRASKYLDLFPDAAAVCFVRDPWQHALSAHAQAQRLGETAPWPGEDPAVTRLRLRPMSLFEMVERFPNLQSSYLAGVPLGRFAMVGLTERYDESLAAVSKLFALPLPAKVERLNANPGRTRPAYDIDPETRRFIGRWNAADVELYRQAQERFDRLVKD